MRWFRGVVFRLAALLGRRDRERDLDAELRFHLEEEAEGAASAGLSAAEAERAARRSLGDVGRTKEATREAWTWLSLERLAQDLRYAVRVLRRRPGFTVTALLSLALGIGASTAVFSLLKTIQLDRLPVDRPDQLVQVSGEQGVNSTYGTYGSLRRATRAFSGVIGSGQASDIDLDEGGERIQAFVEFVTENYFDVLGVAARRGRVFHPPAQAPREAIAVISDAYWRRHYAADLSALGARFRFPVSGLEFTVVGVAPPEFRGVHLDAPADIWVSLEAAAADEFDDWRFRIMGRLRPGETIVGAASETAAILGRPVRVAAGAHGYSALRSRLTPPLLLLALVVGLVLLITYANLANLVLAGMASRERELAVRQAIGASRGRVVCQLVTESVLLSSVGGALGLAVAYWTSAALLSFLPPNQAQALLNLKFQLDLVIVAFVILLSFLTPVVCGLVPALRATRRHTPQALRASTGIAQRHRSWMSRSVLVGEVAMCTLLLVVAGVFLRSLHNLVSQDAGYLADGLVTADLRLPYGYTEARRDLLYEELRARLGALPNVEVASYSHVGPLRGTTFDYTIRVPGRAVGREPETANEARVSPGFLAAMGTRLLAGRDVSDADRAEGAPVALVNEAFARQFGLGADAIGQHFDRGDDSRPVARIEIVGVVEDAKWLTLREEPRPTYYVPYQQSAGRPIVRLAVRGIGDPDVLAQSIVQATQAVDPRFILTNVVPFREIVNRALVVERLVAHVSTAFGLLGLLVAGIGLYGVLAYAVVRRRREIGIRIAVGASPGSVEWMMIRESLVLLVVGFAIGLPAGIVVVRFVSSMLFELQPGDPVTIAATLGTLTMATLAAAYLPARRAANIDPVQALREDM